MSNYELDYIDLIDKVITRGQKREGRNGDTRALFGETFVVEELKWFQFPLLTQRKIFYHGVFGELAAFLRGATKLGEFHDFGCKYWDGNALAWSPNHGLPLGDMSIGQVYGAQWVNWEKSGFNQIEALLEGLHQNPHGRRHVITTFSPTTEACLPPCHLLAQFFVNSNNSLDCMVYMRSVDLILGLPSDVVLYAALLVLIANYSEMTPGVLKFQLGDTHIYENHVEIYQTRQIKQPMHRAPNYTLLPNQVFNFTPDQIVIRDYDFAEVIKYPLNV